MGKSPIGCPVCVQRFPPLNDGRHRRLEDVAPRGARDGMPLRWSEMPPVGPVGKRQATRRPATPRVHSGRVPGSSGDAASGRQSPAERTSRKAARLAPKPGDIDRRTWAGVALAAASPLPRFSKASPESRKGRTGKRVAQALPHHGGGGGE
ncbi:unnamed protein product [Lampetra planeri]